MKHPFCVSFLVALTRKGVMGKDNQLPWHLPEDLKRFRALTMGKPIIMGRKTFDSIGRALPGRRNIVISRNAALTIPGVDVVGSSREALALCASMTPIPVEVFVIGGAQIFQDTLLDADKMYLTWVEKDVEGDVYFPQLDLKDYQETLKEPHPDGPLPYTYANYERVFSGPAL